MEEVLSKIGIVMEVKLNAKEGSLCKMGRARVLLDLALPLKSGVIVNFAKGQHWVDFRYERLPHFCYSCGKIGHFTTNCEEVPYKVVESKEINAGNFGYWLKAEARETSPFWKVFNEDRFSESDEEEVILETLVQEDFMEEVTPTNADHLEETRQLENLTEQRWRKRGNGREEGELAAPGMNHQGSLLKILNTPWQEGNKNYLTVCTQQISKDQLTPAAKKAKKQNQQHKQGRELVTLDEDLLHETPIQVETGSKGWALVASPNKPPGDK